MVERFHPPVRARLHHSPLHRRQDKCGQSVQIKSRREPPSRLFQAPPHRPRPPLKIGRDSLVCRQILRLNLQRQPPQRAAVLAAGLHQPLAISRQNGEDPLNRVAAARERGLHDDRLQTSQIVIQHRQQQRFLAWKKVIKTARIGLRPVQNLCHTRSRITALPEQIPCGIQQTVAS